MTNADDVRVEIHAQGNILHATLHAGRYQQFGARLALLLEELLEHVEADPEIRAVVFSSAHPERFISHADVQWLQEGGAEYLARQQAMPEPAPPAADHVGLDRLHRLFLRMNGLGVIFIAALEGHALGLGAEFAWACDLRVMADEDAFIGQPEILLGIMPGGGGTQRLSRLVGVHASLAAILEGRPFTSKQALALGAVDAAVPKADVLGHALTLAHQLAGRHKPSIGSIKRAVYFGSSLPLQDGIALEAKEFLGLDVAPEGQERMLAYQAGTEALLDLPLYVGDYYQNAITTGRLPARYG
ncbi:enoyl-CoA hydratase/isomerase family protein [Stenotrophomonas sp. ESTM1D_MKCIP4_1]|uniref:enoyl-CoA hydratase/isomerase family protein n=1 Tax=Stenotrophomonas sp. ESTM1D_MKCIP4_1 TaxID=2072414 RepID=UPI000D53D74C|nr:enoyl-CoA hydratase/isomerase family protein [Stenotrophomonas sp. ESTM1D_MKCIP4_1]AWH51835.1 enoyl-CoA hydratase/isomerase family protein [Stenotrophomonas sp. ESTM1D_MKCIP4_1]